MPNIPDDFAAELRRALIVRDEAPSEFVREEGWQTLLLHRAQRLARQSLPVRLHQATPDDAA